VTLGAGRPCEARQTPWRTREREGLLRGQREILTPNACEGTLARNRYPQATDLLCRCMQTSFENSTELDTAMPVKMFQSRRGLFTFSTQGLLGQRVAPTYMATSLCTVSLLLVLPAGIQSRKEAPSPPKSSMGELVTIQGTLVIDENDAPTGMSPTGFIQVRTHALRHSSTIEVTKGKWSYVTEAPDVLSIDSIVTNGHSAALEGSCLLSVDRSLEGVALRARRVYPATIRLKTPDARSPLSMSCVQVFQSCRAFTDSRLPLPECEGLMEVPLEQVADSTFQIPIPTHHFADDPFQPFVRMEFGSLERTYWIRVAGYASKRIHLNHARRIDRTITLPTAVPLTVSLDAWPLGAHATLQVFASGKSGPLATPSMEYRLSGRTLTIQELGAGRCRLVLASGTWYERPVEYWSRDIELVSGEPYVVKVDVDPSILTKRVAECFGEVLLSQDSVMSSGVLRVRSVATPQQEWSIPLASMMLVDRVATHASTDSTERIATQGSRRSLIWSIGHVPEGVYVATIDEWLTSKTLRISSLVRSPLVLDQLKESASPGSNRK
jgi:hypothetical protein